MIIKVNGINRDMTPEEVAEMEKRQAEISALSLNPFERLKDRVDNLEYILTGEVANNAQP